MRAGAASPTIRAWHTQSSGARTAASFAPGASSSLTAPSASAASRSAGSPMTTSRTSASTAVRRSGSAAARPSSSRAAAETACASRPSTARAHSTSSPSGWRLPGIRRDYACPVDAAATGESRLRALFEAGVAVTSELSLDAVLQRLVEVAAQLTGARYAALGVIDETGSQLERFLTHGIDAETHAAIGALPHGRGILGALIHDAKPLRLHNLSEDPRSVGFPPAHPPMQTFLGVPILLRGVAYGNLYLAEKALGEDVTEEDQELVTLLASQAAVAVENARLYEASTRWSRQLQSLNEVGNALATETDLESLLDLVVRNLRELLGARIVAVAPPSGSDDLACAAAAGG